MCSESRKRSEKQGLSKKEVSAALLCYIKVDEDQCNRCKKDGTVCNFRKQLGADPKTRQKFVFSAMREQLRSRQTLKVRKRLRGSEPK